MNKFIGIYAKLTVLVVALIMVIGSYSYFNSSAFKDSVNLLFSIEQYPFSWCSPSHGIFIWKDPKAIDIFKHHSKESVLTQLCTLNREAPPQDLDYEKLVWQPLAEAKDSDGRTAVLEWIPEHKLYRAGKLPFKSTKLSDLLGLK